MPATCPTISHSSQNSPVVSQDMGLHLLCLCRLGLEHHSCGTRVDPYQKSTAHGAVRDVLHCAACLVWPSPLCWAVQKLLDQDNHSCSLEQSSPQALPTGCQHLQHLHGLNCIWQFCNKLSWQRCFCLDAELMNSDFLIRKLYSNSTDQSERISSMTNCMWVRDHRVLTLPPGIPNSWWDAWCSVLSLAS